MSLWWRIGGGAFLAMNAMVFSVALNGSEVTKDEKYLLELTVLCVSMPVFALLSSEFLVATWQAIRRRQLSIEFLFLIGIVASLTGSVLYFVRGKGNGYADIAAMLLVIYALGRQIGAYGKQRVLTSLSEWAPQNRRVRRMNGGEEQLVTSADIQTGDRIRVLPGECVSADMSMLSDGALVHEASITGESLAVRKRQGDLIRAGSFPLDGLVDGEAIGEAGASEIDRVKQLIESGLARPGAEQRSSRRVSRAGVLIDERLRGGRGLLSVHPARGLLNRLVQRGGLLYPCLLIVSPTLYPRERRGKHPDRKHHGVAVPFPPVFDGVYLFLFF